MVKKLQNKVVVYQAKSGAIELRGDFGAETIWATQLDIVRLYGKDQSVISRHITAVFKDEEVNQESNMQKMHIANSDKPVTFYSLDVILAVGYRTNSARAIEFRKWATRTLRGYITKGFVVNRSQIEKNYRVFLDAVEDIKQLLPVGSSVAATDAVELVSLFADTWLSLDAYDKDALPHGKLTKKKVGLTAEKMNKGLVELKAALLQKKQLQNSLAANKPWGQSRESWVM